MYYIILQFNTILLSYSRIHQTLDSLSRDGYGAAVMGCQGLTIPRRMVISRSDPLVKVRDANGTQQGQDETEPRQRAALLRRRAASSHILPPLTRVRSQSSYYPTFSYILRSSSGSTYMQRRGPGRLLERLPKRDRLLRVQSVPARPSRSSRHYGPGLPYTVEAPGSSLITVALYVGQSF